MPNGIFSLEYRGSKLLVLNRAFGAHDCTSVWDSMTDGQDPAQDRPDCTSTKRKDEAIATRLGPARPASSRDVERLHGGCCEQF